MHPNNPMKKPLQIERVGFMIDGGFGVTATATNALTAIMMMTARTRPVEGALLALADRMGPPGPGMFPLPLGPLGGLGGVGTRVGGFTAIDEL